MDGVSVESTVGPGKSPHDGNRYRITLKAQCHSSYCSLRFNASGSSVILRMFVQQIARLYILNIIMHVCRR